MKETLIGKVVHFYGNAMVIVIKPEVQIAVGETIKIKRGEEEFEQKIESMQVNHEAVKLGERGQEVAIQVEQPTKVGAEVYRVEE